METMEELSLEPSSVYSCVGIETLLYDSQSICFTLTFACATVVRPTEILTWALDIIITFP